jgi:hypothetical protein
LHKLENISGARLKGKCQCGRIHRFEDSDFEEGSLVFKEPLKCECDREFNELDIKKEEPTEVKAQLNTSTSYSTKSNAEFLKGISIISYVISLGLVIAGLVITYYYPSYDSNLNIGNKFNHVVGGDAYNYIIIGVRGLGLITIGVGFAIVGSAFLISYYLKGLNRK